MRVKNASLVFLIIAMLFCGCGKESIEVETKEFIDLSDIGSQLVSSIDDVYINSLPLVKKVTTCTKSGKIKQVVEYEYDDKNRLSKERISYVNELTGEIVPYFESTYTYDEFFMYKETIHLTKHDLKTMEIFDSTGKGIVSQKVDVNNQIRSENYNYRLNNNQLFCYKGEYSEFEYCQSNYYDDQGNLKLTIKQYANDSIEKQFFEYKYDEKNRLVQKNCVIESIGNYGFDACGSEVNEIYEYDKKNRLIKKEVITKILSDRVTKEITEYSYENGYLSCELISRIVANNDDVTLSDTEQLLKYEY